MARLIAVYDKCENIKLKKRQLPIIVDDNKIMVMQLSDTCECCELFEPLSEYTNGSNTHKEDRNGTFLHQYGMLSREEVLSALMVPAKTLFARLTQVVGCVGCRRSVERLFYQLKDSGNPAMEPVVISATGLLTILMKISLQPRVLSSLFAEHRGMSEIFSAIPKLKKSGRCVLHSMEGVRCRPGSQAWLDMWEGMTAKCKDTITLISSDQLLTTLDNYLRKHRFCHECKNKVHRAYNILVGNINIDPNKEKGYVASLYAGIRKCSKKHIHVSSETDYLMHLITRAEPELQGRRERHAKTLEIAQEEVLTCVGLFLYERLQRVQTRLREEEQTWEILFHVGLDALKRNFELAIEKKQGFSKFDMLCEELQRQEIIEKAKKEKKKRKKNKKKIDENKDNSCDDEQSCEDCEINQTVSPVFEKKMLATQIPLDPPLEDEVSPNEDDDDMGPEWHIKGKTLGLGKPRIKPHSCPLVTTRQPNGYVPPRPNSRGNNSLDTFDEPFEPVHRPHLMQPKQYEGIDRPYLVQSRPYEGIDGPHMVQSRPYDGIDRPHLVQSGPYERLDRPHHLVSESHNNNSCSENFNVVHNDKMVLTSGTSCTEDNEPNGIHHDHEANHLSHSPQHLSANCSVSIDSLASKCSTCCKDGGYCSGSAQCSAYSNNCSSGSSRDSSEAACGEGLCSHPDDCEHRYTKSLCHQSDTSHGKYRHCNDKIDTSHKHRHLDERTNIGCGRNKHNGASDYGKDSCTSEGSNHQVRSVSNGLHHGTCNGDSNFHSNGYTNGLVNGVHNGVDHDDDPKYAEDMHENGSTAQFTMSLQQMLCDSSGSESEEIPEAEVKAWHARQGVVVKQKRDELRETLKERFQQMCHRKPQFNMGRTDVDSVKPLHLNSQLNGF